MAIRHIVNPKSSSTGIPGQQLQEFRQAQKRIMAGFAAALSDDDMKISLTGVPKAKPGFAGQGTSLGERIYRGGIADRQIAACAGCHSPTGAAFQPCTAPGRQHAEYTATADVFRDGIRKQPCK
jgi:cytochrome c553